MFAQTILPVTKNKSSLNPYLIKQELSFEQTVGGKNKEAIPDFTLISRYQIKGLIIVEDEKSQGDAYAQIIAEGIAVAQQSDWKCEWPIYSVYIED